MTRPVRPRLLGRGLWVIRNQLWRLRERFLQDAVLIHINKTGGTSVGHALRLRGGHWTAREKRAALGARAWAQKFSFAFVRNPWDRLVSQYHWRTRNNRTGLRTNPLEFNDWVVAVFGEKDPRYHDEPKMFIPQLEWITDDDGRVMVDFVGRFENLAQDFELICRRLGVVATLPHLNRTAHAPYSHYYRAETVEIVRAWFRKDFNFFGYADSPCNDS
ncbi:MAG: sulfotransferase family 2 domain-containing protein [Caldilineaceae bacterium]|nr:sulfotransferase family 2 domain-containing protein [Caldilineaceae bacterium]